MLDTLPRLLLWAAALSTAIVLSACSSPESPSGASPSTPVPAIPSPSEASETPLASPAPDELSADPSEWTIGFDGVGPVAVGDTPSMAQDAATPAYTAAPEGSCPNPMTSILVAPANPTIWLQTPGEGADAISLIAIGGDVLDDVRIDGSPRTQEGIGVGATVDDVRAAYPDGSLELGPESEPDRFIVEREGAPDGPAFLVFDFFEDSVQTILIQSDQEVVDEFCG